MTCTTCGQHYYIAFLKDFIFTGRQPGGGEAGGGSHWWPSLEEAHGGKRVVLLFIGMIGFIAAIAAAWIAKRTYRFVAKRIGVHATEK